MIWLVLIVWWFVGTGAELWAASLLHESHPALAALLLLSAFSGVVAVGVGLISERD